MIKECLITVGATAKFPELIQAALSSEVLQSFSDNGFTRLNFQCGDSLSEFESYRPSDTKGLEIKAFAFNKDGLNKEMRATQAKSGVSEKGMVICHAGAGSVLDAMRLGLSIIVVPNMTLLDNHQEELANELQKQGYVTKATTKNLAKKITTACKKEEKAWGGHSASFASVVDEVVGYEDDVRARLD